MSYLPIMSPFSLDKVGSDTSPHPTGIFSEFKNYIPNKHVIETRKGISEFFFSGGVYNPADDPDCVMWLRMESTGTLGNCEINGNNYMDKVGTPSASASYMEGSGSMHTDAFTGSGNYLRRANTALRTDFPGVGSRNFMICFWVNIDWGGDHIYFTNKETIISSANIALQYITPDLIGRVGDASEMKWSDWGRQFIITPVPTGIYTLKPLVLVEQGCTAAGTLGIPGCYHHLVPLYATYKAYQKRRSFELAGAVAQQYDAELGGILATITTKFMVNSIKQSIANQSAAD